MRSKYNLASFQGYIPRLLLYEKQGELQAIKNWGLERLGTRLQDGACMRLLFVLRQVGRYMYM